MAPPLIALLVIAAFCWLWVQKFIELMLLLALLVIFFFCWFWVEKFVELMPLEDRYFPGRFDKIIWAGMFVLVAPLAPFAFQVWKTARTAERATAVAAP